VHSDPVPDVVGTSTMGSPGAFTGARKGGKKGLIEQAHKGTIFLDEIGEMPVQLQARLLRVLEEREVMRVGSDGVIPVDVRVISATNTNLEAAIARGAFREDLYYRLNTLIIHIPPLRSRTDDIAALAEEFIQHYCRKLGAPPKRLTEEAVQALQAYPWPGNVRELKNVMERIVISVDSQVVDARDVSALLYHGSGDEGRARQAGQDRQARQAGTEGKAGTEAGVNTGAGAGAVGEPEPLSDIELRAIDRALKAAGGNRTLAAKMLGISRTTLWRKLRALR